MKLEARNISFSYGDTLILNDISFKAPENGYLAVLGPNGAGKSTLFRIILGLEKIQHGELMLDGRCAETSQSKLAQSIAFVPQTHAPSFGFSVFEMVLMGTTARLGRYSSPGRRQKEIAHEALEKVGIATLAKRNYQQISGGEKQLTLIARALAQEAQIIIMDEPTASLDYGNQLRVLACVKDLCRNGYTIIQSTHNPDHAFIFADCVLALYNHRIAAFGPADQVLTCELIERLYGIEVRILDADGIRTTAPTVDWEQIHRKSKRKQERRPE